MPERLTADELADMADIGKDISRYFTNQGKMKCQTPDETFSQLVEKSWTIAVSIASHEIASYRSQLLEALHSPNPEKRSAAVASFYEASDAEAHDDIIPLLDDEHESVRQEVAEYLQDFAISEDYEILLAGMTYHSELGFSLNIALQRITTRGK